MTVPIFANAGHIVEKQEHNQKGRKPCILRILPEFGTRAENLFEHTQKLWHLALEYRVIPNAVKLCHDHSGNVPRLQLPRFHPQ